MARRPVHQVFRTQLGVSKDPVSGSNLESPDIVVPRLGSRRSLQFIEAQFAPTSGDEKAGAQFLPRFNVPGDVIAARRAAQLAPQSIWWHTAASKALDLGRPREALDDLAVFGPDGGWLKDWPAYWGARLTALHNLGEYQEQLALARSAPGLPRPDRRPAWGPPLFDMHQLYALAALGRLDELDQLTDSLVNDFLGRGWSRNVSDTYHWVGRELRAHGFPDHARQYFERCIAHIPEFREYRFECMLEAGQYAEVYAYFVTQMDRPPNHARDTWAAVAAARLGHRDKAEWHLTRVLQAWPAKARHSNAPGIHTGQNRGSARREAAGGRHPEAGALSRRPVLRHAHQL